VVVEALDHGLAPEVDARDAQLAEGVAGGDIGRGDVVSDLGEQPHQRPELEGRGLWEQTQGEGEVEIGLVGYQIGPGAQVAAGGQEDLVARGGGDRRAGMQEVGPEGVGEEVWGERLEVDAVVVPEEMQSGIF